MSPGLHLRRILSALSILGIAAVMVTITAHVPTTKTITWVELLNAIAFLLIIFGVSRLITYTRHLTQHAEDNTEPSIYDTSSQEQLNELALSILTHELAHAIVAHRLGLDVWSVSYGPTGGFCHTSARREGSDENDWAARAATSAAGLLIPVNNTHWNHDNPHGAPGVDDDALNLYRRSLYGAIQTQTHEAEYRHTAIETARALLPTYNNLHHAAQSLYDPPKNGWAPTQSSRRVPDQQLRGFLTTQL